MERLTPKKIVDQIKKKVNLENIDLSYMNLSGADLREAKLTNSNCDGADFSNCILISVDFYCAQLKNANFQDAILMFANLSGQIFSRLISRALFWLALIYHTPIFAMPIVDMLILKQHILTALISIMPTRRAQVLIIMICQKS